MNTVQMISMLTCPLCGHQSAETMPIDACEFFFECAGCGVLLKAKAGDRCVFCSYGDVPCLQVMRASETSQSYCRLSLEQRPRPCGRI